MPTTDRMPTPEIGLLDAPMRPAMYPHTDAITTPAIRMYIDAECDRHAGLAAIGSVLAKA